MFWRGGMSCVIRFAYVRFAVLSLVIAGLAGRASAARVLSQYDADSLCALSDLVVKAEVGEMRDVRTRDGDCAVTTVTVLSVLKGDAKVGAEIRVAGVEEYKKAPGLEGVGEDRYPRLSKGDVVYLFLATKDAPQGYAKYRLTDADWKVVESGARLVVKDRVLGFRQYFPELSAAVRAVAGPIPGFVAATERTFPKAPVQSVEEFERRVKESAGFIDDLRRRIAAGDLTAAERADLLRSRHAVLKREQAAPDHLPRFIEVEEARAAATRRGGPVSRGRVAPASGFRTSPPHAVRRRAAGGVTCSRLCWQM
jgi:hypothetical protein